MRVIIQRSKKGKVEVEGKMVNSIESGMVILVGFTHGDTIENIEKMVKKIANLRIFDDDSGVMNKSILDCKGSILSISQFTLYADTKKGNRPSYMNALNNADAKILYDIFNEKMNELVPTKTGVFGAEMLVSIENDGPITITLEN